MTDRIADYQLLRELGHGNYGTVHLAQPPARIQVDDEFVAVKVFSSRTRVTPASFRAAVAELEAVSAVGSAELVRLLDVGQEQGAFYYSMEYLPRGSLAGPAQPPSRAQVLRAVADVARAAHALHEAGIVHRDIKPGNVLLHPDGGRLADVGLAHLLAPGMTVTSTGGTRSLEFLDPSVLNGAPSSRASDIWALGVTVHVALTGAGVHPALQRADVLEAMRTVAGHRPVLDPQLSEAQRALVTSCLDPEPSHRPRTALDVARRLDELVSQSLSSSS